MDRKRNRKNATGNKKVIFQASFLLGATIILFACTQPEKTINRVKVLPHISPVSQQHQTQTTRHTQLSKQQRFSAVLKAHNQVRLKHHLAPLKWSDKLANYSQEWANHLGRGNQCQMYHRGGSTPYGENLYISSAEIWSDNTGKEVARRISPVTIREVVNSWAGEERWYDYQANRCQLGKQCGHYTQIVWRNTTEVGCAMKVCADKSQVWVCSYNPPGNYVGKRPY